MDWLPKWLGKRYSKLWVNFKENIFNFQQAAEILGKYTSNYISELKKNESLFVFDKHGKVRRYRLIPPKIFVYNYHYGLNLNWLKQTTYANLILKFFRVLNENLADSLISVGIYGSLARGKAGKESDIDLFLLVENLEMSLLERTNYILKIKKNKWISDEIDFLNSEGYYPRLNTILKPKEELIVNFFTIDIHFDMKILYDKGELREFLDRIKNRVKKEGIKRVYYDNDKYYLDLNIEYGEVFEF